jgi:invasion protein IalB
MRMTRTLTWALLALGLAGGLGAGMAPGTARAQADEGPSSVQETYRDWVVNCVTPQATEAMPAPERVCEMRQELRQAEGNQLVLATALQPNVEGSDATLTFVAPFGLLLSAPIGVDVGETRVAEVPYRTCLPRGCIALTALDETVIDALAAGAEAQVSLTATEGQTLGVVVSLSGFTAAWNRLLELAGS